MWEREIGIVFSADHQYIIEERDRSVQLTDADRIPERSDRDTNVSSEASQVPVLVQETYLACCL